MRRSLLRSPLVLLAATTTLLTACGGGGDSGGGTVTPPPGNNPTIALGASTTALSVAQGASGTATITVTRGGGYTGAVDLTLEGAPTGVTGTFAPASIASGATTSTLTVNAAAAAAAATTNLTVRARGSGVTDATTTIPLTVTAVATPSFTLALAPTTVSVQQGQNGTVNATLTRAGGFAGAVALAVTGAPNGVTVTPNPVSVAGTTSAIGITVGAAVAPGNYTLQVKGTGTGVTDQTAALTLTVTQAPASGGNVSFAFCGDATQIPIWVAAQDGDGAWTRVTAGANDTYKFNVASGRGGIAYVLATGGGGYALDVFYGTKDELIAQGGAVCATGTKTVNGSVAGLAAGDQASITLGGAVATVMGGMGTTFQLRGVPGGPVDLLAGRAKFAFGPDGFTSSLDKLIIRRGLNPAAGSTLPVLDFGGAEAFDPVRKTLTINGLNGDASMVSQSYTTANGGSGDFYTDMAASGTTRPFFGVPAAKQAAGDLHTVVALAFPAGEATPSSARVASVSFKDATDRTLTLGPALSQGTVTTVATTPFVQLRAQFARQPEYDNLYAVTYTQGMDAGAAARLAPPFARHGATMNRAMAADPRVVMILMTSQYFNLLGGNVLSLLIPNLAGVAGWNPAWGLSPNVLTLWTLMGYGWAIRAGIFHAPTVENGIVQAAMRMGSLTP